MTCTEAPRTEQSLQGVALFSPICKKRESTLALEGFVKSHVPLAQSGACGEKRKVPWLLTAFSPLHHKQAINQQSESPSWTIPAFPLRYSLGFIFPSPLALSIILFHPFNFEERGAFTPCPKCICNPYMPSWPFLLRSLPKKLTRTFAGKKSRPTTGGG